TESDTSSLHDALPILGEKAMAQVADPRLFAEPVKGINSMAIIVQHLHGNMKSRWKDFLTTDGEKSWRNRDGEFELSVESREHILDRKSTRLNSSHVKI